MDVPYLLSSQYALSFQTGVALCLKTTVTPEHARLMSIVVLSRAGGIQTSKTGS